MTLEQHLADTSRSSEVAVNLEGRMSVEQIGVGASARTTAVRTLILVGADVGEQFLIDMIGLFLQRGPAQCL